MSASVVIREVPFIQSVLYREIPWYVKAEGKASGLAMRD